MSYDEGLAQRLRELFSDQDNVIEKKCLLAWHLWFLEIYVVVW